MTEASTFAQFMKQAFAEAQAGLAEGGLPIGSVLVIDNQIVGRGHNRRVQQDSVIRHAEMDCLENAGRLRAQDYRRSVLYSTLSPCIMCSGATLLYRIPHVVVGDNKNFLGAEDLLRSHGVTVHVLNDPDCIRMMEEFIRTHADLWHEDIGL
jgi:cytosine deaminase